MPAATPSNPSRHVLQTDVARQASPATCLIWVDPLSISMHNDGMGQSKLSRSPKSSNHSILGALRQSCIFGDSAAVAHLLSSHAMFLASGAEALGPASREESAGGASATFPCPQLVFEYSRALRYASYFGNAKCIELLFDSGRAAGLLSPAHYNETTANCLRMAAGEGHVECVKFLMPFLANGALRSGKILALREAIDNGRVAVVEAMAALDPTLIAEAQDHIDPSDQSHLLIAPLLLAIEESRALALAADASGPQPPSSSTARL